MKRYLAGLFFIVLFAVLLGISLTAKDRMTFLFVHLSYYLTFLLVFLWAVVSVRLVKSLNLPVRKVLPTYSKAAAAALLITLVVFLTVMTDFRTLSDETNLLSVSRNMFSQKKIHNITAGKYYYDNFHPLTKVVPKRPFVYPFLTSMLHSLVGFRPANAFLLNYIAFFLFLTGIFIVARKYTDSLSAIAALFLVAAYPVVTIYAACAGFDLMNAFFFFLTFTGLYAFMQQPSKEKFAFMWVMFLIIANTRYESIVYFLIAVPGLLIFRFIRLETIKSHFCLICLSPMLMLPFLWQRILMQGKEGNPKDEPIFSFDYFPDNFSQFIRAQFDFSFHLPYANLINLISFFIILWLIYVLIKRWRSGEISTSNIQFFILFCASVAANLTMMFFLFCGNYTHPSNARYFIIPSLTFAFALIALRKIHPTLLRSESILVFSLAMFFLYHPVAMEDRFTNTLILNREFRQAARFIRELDDKNALIVYHRPNQFAAMGLGAVKFNYAGKNANLLLRRLSNGFYSDIVVMQRIQYTDQKPVSDCQLPKNFNLKTLEKIQISSKIYLRISKVVSEGVEK